MWGLDCDEAVGHVPAVTPLPLRRCSTVDTDVSVELPPPPLPQAFGDGTPPPPPLPHVSDTSDPHPSGRQRTTHSVLPQQAGLRCIRRWADSQLLSRTFHKWRRKEYTSGETELVNAVKQLSQERQAAVLHLTAIQNEYSAVLREREDWVERNTDPSVVGVVHKEKSDGAGGGFVEAGGGGGERSRVRISRHPQYTPTVRPTPRRNITSPLLQPALLSPQVIRDEYSMRSASTFTLK